MLELLEARAAERGSSEHDLVARRRELDDLGRLQPAPDGVAETRSSVDGVAVATFSPTGRSGNRSILYLHGGGYCRGSIDSHAGLAARLALASGADVYLPDYHLAPEHPFPTALHDAVAIYRWMTGPLALPAASMALAGDSAGGGLAVATLTVLRDEGAVLPAGAVLISPWLDLRKRTPDRRDPPDLDPVITSADLTLSTDWYVGEGSPDDPLVSPVLADLRGLPPILVQVGTRELLLDDALAFAAAARSQGAAVTVDVHEGMVHCWHLFTGTPESHAGIADIAGFCDRQWSSHSTADGGPVPDAGVG